MNQTAFMENLRQLFAECDIDRNGSLGREEFGELCSKIGLDKAAAAETFERLDVDKDQKITFEEFAAGFNQYKQVADSSSSPSPTRGPAPAASPSRLPAAARSPKTGPRSEKLAPVAVRGRKSASPIGVLSLGSAGSSRSGSSGSSGPAGNSLTPAARSRSAADGRSGASSSVDISDQFEDHGSPRNADEHGCIVYSSDMIGEDLAEPASGGSGGQFGSLLSSGSGYSQVRTMQELLECVQKLQNENQILTQIFFKDKREREEYISQLGEEFDQQLKEVEERANRRAREELESEKKRLSEMMQTERETLQHHYLTLERMSKLVRSPNGKSDDGDSIDKVRSKLEDTSMENRQLKRSLLDTRSDVAMIWKEMEKLKRQYEDKLSSAYEKHSETKSECDHIKQQLSLMKDSNRKLQDASDVITHYIADKVEPVIKVASAMGGSAADSSSSMPTYPNSSAVSPANSRRGSILSEYLNGNQSDESQSAADAESMASSRGKANETAKTTRTSLVSSPNAGHHLRPSASDGKLTGKDIARSSGRLRRELEKAAAAKPATDDEVEGELGNKNSISHQHDEATQAQHGQDLQQQQRKHSTEDKAITSGGNKTTGLKGFGRHFLIGARTQSDAKLKDLQKTEPALEVRSASADNAAEPIVEPADGPSRATFNIILVGDSFVGKSSFAARFMEGSFVQGLISNCSIDFKTKAYKVDGNNYTVNLWDTA